MTGAAPTTSTARVRRRSLLLWTCTVASYIFATTAYGVWTFHQTRADMLAQIDALLVRGARTVKYLLPEDFHDRATAEGCISPEEDHRNIRALNKFVADAGFKYLYALIQVDGTLYFTASSNTPEDLRTKPCLYFTSYDEAHRTYRDAFDSTGPVFFTNSDRWGSFRTGLFPEISPQGRRYVAGADFSLDYVNAVLVDRTTHAMAIAVLVILAFSAPLLFLYRHATRASIDTLTREIAERAKAESALREATDAYGAVVNGVPSGLCIYRYIPPDRLVFDACNAAAERLVGGPLDYHRGDELDKIWPQAKALGLTGAFINVASTGVPYEGETVAYTDGRVDGVFKVAAFALPDNRIAVAFEHSAVKRAAAAAVDAPPDPRA